MRLACEGWAGLRNPPSGQPLSDGWGGAWDNVPVVRPACLEGSDQGRVRQLRWEDPAALKAALFPSWCRTMSKVVTYSPEFPPDATGGQGNGREPAPGQHAARTHLARPARESNFDFLAINVPATFQQGLIADGEDPSWGELRLVSTARERHGMHAGILDAHRLRLRPDQIKDQLSRIKPRVVGLNPTSVNVAEAQAITRICDNMGIECVIGGVDATLDPKICRKHFPDAAAIVRGPGEVVLEDLVPMILGQRKTAALPGVYFRGVNYSNHDAYAPQLDLDLVPPVNQAILVEDPIYNHEVMVHGESRMIREASVFCTSGCPCRCSFCCSPKLCDQKQGAAYQRPHTYRIIQDIAHCVRDLGADAIHVLDDMAFAKAADIRAFHNALEERGLLGTFIWRGMTRVSTLLNAAFSDEIMDLMVDSGCWKVAVGIESGNDEMLRRIRKMVTVQQVIDATRKLARFGIQMKGFFIMGFPLETEGQIRQTQDLVFRLKDIGMTELSLFQFKPYPGTEDFERLKESNPGVLERLDYLRITDSGATNDKAKYRTEQHDAWLPDDLMVAEIPSDKVKQYVISTLESFYGKKMST